MKRLTLALFVLLALFNLLPAMAQSGSAQIYSTAQRFDGGLMIWRSDTSLIWVLGNNGQVLTFPASSYSNLADDPVAASASNQIRPINGFGKVWSNNRDVRNLIGWPTLPEIGFNMGIEVNDGTAYLTQLDGSIYQINPDKTWATATQLPVLPSSRVVSLTASSDGVAPGGTLTVNWNVVGAEVVLLDVTGATDDSYIFAQQDLPLVGSMTVTVPATQTGDIRVVVRGANHIPTFSMPMFEQVARAQLIVGVQPLTNVQHDPSTLVNLPNS